GSPTRLLGGTAGHSSRRSLTASYARPGRQTRPPPRSRGRAAVSARVASGPSCSRPPRRRRQPAAAARLRKRKDGWRDEKVGTYEVAFIYAALGEKDQAIEWLEKAYEVRDQGLAFLKVDPPLDPLRSDPRFERILRRMNFPS